MHLYSLATLGRIQLLSSASVQLSGAAGAAGGAVYSWRNSYSTTSKYHLSKGWIYLTKRIKETTGINPATCSIIHVLACQIFVEIFDPRRVGPRLNQIEASRRQRIFQLYNPVQRNVPR